MQSGTLPMVRKRASLSLFLPSPRMVNGGQTNYSAAKAGLVAMTALWAGELGRYGIRAGAIAPGFTVRRS